MHKLHFYVHVVIWLLNIFFPKLNLSPIFKKKKIILAIIIIFVASINIFLIFIRIKIYAPFVNLFQNRVRKYNFPQGRKLQIINERTTTLMYKKHTNNTNHLYYLLTIKTMHIFFFLDFVLNNACIFLFLDFVLFII